MWLVEIEHGEVRTLPRQDEEDVSIEAVAGLASKLECEAEQLASLRAILQRTLGGL